eukprot:6468302-Amphidinium_carterae.1
MLRQLVLLLPKVRKLHQALARFFGSLDEHALTEMKKATYVAVFEAAPATQDLQSDFMQCNRKPPLGVDTLFPLLALQAGGVNQLLRNMCEEQTTSYIVTCSLSLNYNGRKVR